MSTADEARAILDRWLCQFVPVSGRTAEMRDRMLDLWEPGELLAYGDHGPICDGFGATVTIPGIRIDDKNSSAVYFLSDRKLYLGFAQKSGIMSKAAKALAIPRRDIRFAGTQRGAKLVQTFDWRRLSLHSDGDFSRGSLLASILVMDNGERIDERPRNAIIDLTRALGFEIVNGDF